MPNIFAATVHKQAKAAYASRKFGATQLTLTDKRRSERVREAAGGTEKAEGAEKKPKHGSGKTAKGKEAANGSGGALPFYAVAGAEGGGAYLVHAGKRFKVPRGGWMPLRWAQPPSYS